MVVSLGRADCVCEIRFQFLGGAVKLGEREDGHYGR